jgi:hypothetical protein
MEVIVNLTPGMIPASKGCPRESLFAAHVVSGR